MRTVRRSVATCWLLALCGTSWVAPGCSAKHAAPSSASHSLGPNDAAAAKDASDGAQARASDRHHIVTRDCKERRYGQSFDVKPDPACTGQPGSCYGVECLGPDDCKDGKFPRCLSSGEGKCIYGAIAGGEPCIADSECTMLPGGRCTGTVSYTTCQYANGCATDADCPAQHRCDCNADGDLFCAFLGCAKDTDCGPSERCLRTNPCGWGPFGDYRCTTPQDECDAAQGGCCDYDPNKGRWICISFICD